MKRFALLNTLLIPLSSLVLAADKDEISPPNHSLTLTQNIDDTTSLKKEILAAAQDCSKGNQAIDVALIKETVEIFCPLSLSYRVKFLMSRASNKDELLAIFENVAKLKQAEKILKLKVIKLLLNPENSESKEIALIKSFLPQHINIKAKGRTSPKPQNYLNELETAYQLNLTTIHLENFAVEIRKLTTPINLAMIEERLYSYLNRGFLALRNGFDQAKSNNHLCDFFLKAFIKGCFAKKIQGLNVWMAQIAEDEFIIKAKELAQTSGKINVKDLNNRVLYLILSN